MPELPEVCFDSPNYAHGVEGDHHGDYAVCVHCSETVEYVSGRWVSVDPPSTCRECGGSGINPITDTRCSTCEAA